jgi:regulator of replication initiation timing
MIEPKDEMFEMNVTASIGAMHMENNFDELIENVEYYTREVANNTERSMNTSEVKRLLVDSRKALTDAISAVTSERDVSKAQLETIIDRQMENEKLLLERDALKAKLAEANEIAHLLYTTNASANACVVYEEHRARLAKDES